MKTIATPLFLLLTCFSTSAQDLDFVHSYGPTEDGDSNDQVHFSRFEENYDRMLVGGQYFDEINLEIGSMSSSLEAEMNDMLQGFLAIYSDQNETETYYNLGSIVTDARMITDSTFAVIGRFMGSHDLDPRPEHDLIYEGSGASHGFIGYYQIDGTPLWLSRLTTIYGVSLNDAIYYNESLTILGYSYATDLTLVNENEEIDLENELGFNTFLLNYSLSGDLNWHKLYDLPASGCIARSLNQLSGKFEVSMWIGEGNIDLSLTSDEEIITIPADRSSLVTTYDLNNTLSHYSTLEAIDEDNNAIPQTSGSHALYGSLTAYLCEGEGMWFSASAESDGFEISASNDQQFIELVCQSPEGKIKWRSNLSFSESLFTTKISINKFGYSYITGYYRGSVFGSGDEIIEENASPLNNGFIMKLDPLGNLVWAHNIPSQQGELEVNTVSVNQEQDLLISGYYTGNHDFDFSGSTEYVGNFEEENGFLARYTQEPNEAEVFLNVPILHTEIEEAGATSLVYVSINREISQNVVVEATPDEQIDLGNGAGQPVELTFTPDEEKIMSLDVTAFDDMNVEGDHTGTITFSTSGESNFASLDDLTKTFEIIDNDPDGIEEQSAEAQLSVYPNPATDEITIDYPENLPGKTIDLIRILDVNGRVVLEIKDHQKDQPVSVEGISRGSYILKVNSGGSEFSSKLVIQ